MCYLAFINFGNFLERMKLPFRVKPNVNLRRRRNIGQAISEYAMLLAFIAVLVALVFAFAPGKLAPAVSSAFSRMAQELNDMADAADNASSFIQILDIQIVKR